MTFGSIETRIRRDLLNDNDADQYRWTVASVMSAMNRAVKLIPTKINGWAGMTENGTPITALNTAQISSLCDAVPPSAEITAEQIATLRAIAMPLQERYADAVAYLASAMLLETDDSDTANAQKAATYMQKGKEEAMS